VIAKQADVASALPGDTVTWTVTVTNDSTAAALDVVVTDDLPPGFTFQSATANCTAAGSQLTCALGAINGVTGVNVATFDVVTTANHTAAGACTNTASVTGTAPSGNSDVDLTNNTASATVACDLLGSIGDFIWNDVDNDGVQDPGEAGIGGVTVTLSGGPGGTSVSAGDGFYPLFTDLPAGDYTVTVDTSTAPAGMVPTTPTAVSVTLAAGQTFLDADFGFFTPPPTTIDLELSKSVDQSVVPLGTNVTWTITVVNQGPADATGVTVTDTLPAGVSYVSDTGGGAFDSATATWTIGNLAAGASASLQVTTTINTEGVKVNRAQIASADQDDVDSTPGNCPVLPAAAGEDDCADAEVGTVLQATTTTTTTTTVADTLVKTGPREQTRDLGVVGLAMVLLGAALVLAAGSSSAARRW
jgi:uncharacterized repeat protein (TIGR01451 family)